MSRLPCESTIRRVCSTLTLYIDPVASNGSSSASQRHKAIKRYQVVNEVCYEKVFDQAGKNQTLVFVHFQKETAKIAKFIRDMAIKETITQFVRPDSVTREILNEESRNVKDGNLKDLLQFGFIHNASMTREDRGLVEELFADGSVQVLVCTATLA